MPRIETVQVIGALPLVVSGDDRDFLGHAVQYSDKKNLSYAAVTVYNAEFGQKGQRPVATRPDGDEAVVQVTVSGIPPNLMSTGLIITTDASGSAASYLRSDTIIPNQDSETSGDKVMFQLGQLYGQVTNPMNPWCCWGHIKFSIYAAQDNSIVGESLYDEVIPLEIYVIHCELPKYLANGIPLLLLRMFVGAATAQNIVTAEEWVAMVVKICHGSAEPITGAPSSTEKHWLKYDAYGGGCRFVRPNSDLPQSIRYWNYGGDFRLSAWLEAYRLFLSHGDFTLVNCYDQAAATEVALSLGIDYNTVAWEYHQTFGFISPKSELVGWGYSNNPFFKNKKTPKMISEQDSNRSFFRNHAFLSWSPDFHPEKEANFFNTNPDPSLYTACKMLAIDACAGPHLGGEERGVWINPGTYPPKYTDESTYWKCRDDNYNTATFNTTKKLLDPDFHTYNIWTAGITGLRSDRETSNFAYVPPDSPFAGSGIVFPDPDAFSGDGKVLGGKISSLQSSFRNYLKTNLNVGDDWKSVPVADVKLGNGSIEHVMRLIDPDPSSVNYYSLQVTVTPNISQAVRAFKAQANHLVVTSNLEAEDFQPSVVSSNGDGIVHALHSDYASIILCLNVMVEVNSNMTEDKMKPLVDQLCQELVTYPTVTDSAQWQAILS